MTEQWQELKETITEMRDNGGTGTQQDVCKFLANYMETLEKQMQEPMRDATEEERKSVKDYIKSISKPTGVQFDAQLTDLTAEEKEIIDAIHKMGLFRTNYANDKVSKAVSKIIKAYDAQPCEDCISRKMAVEAVAEALKNTFVEYEDIAKKIIGKLPSVTPQRTKGKWIWNEKIGAYICSICDKDFDYEYPCCPNCGAEMSGGGEDEDGKSL